MPERLNLNAEPPEPSGDRTWPDFVLHSYGANEALVDATTNDEAYPYGYLGWFVRMGHHVVSLIGEETGRTDDAAVLAAALLLDVETERSMQKDHEEGLALLNEVQGLLLARLRQYSLPTGASLYQPEEVACVLSEWSDRLTGVRTQVRMPLANYLEEVMTVHEAAGRVTVRRSAQMPVVEVSEGELRSEVAARLRALAADVERGTLKVQEIRTSQQDSFLEVLVKARTQPDTVKVESSQ